MANWETTVIFGIVSLTFLFFWQSFKVSEEHWAYKLFTHLMGWAGMILVTALLHTIVQTSEPTATDVISLIDRTLYILIFTFFAIFMYWLIYYIYSYYKGNVQPLFQMRKKVGVVNVRR